jgi:exosortase
MSTAPQSLAGERIEFNTAAAIRAGVVALCFFAVFYNVFLDLQYNWIHDADWSHGWIIPLFSLWFLYQNWDKIRRVPVVATWVGLPIMLAGLLGYLGALFGLIPYFYFRPFAMLVCLLGIVIFLCGLPIMRYAWLPWAYLFFAVPLPKRLYFQLTDPLRRLAATVSAATIPNLEIQRKGSILEYMYGGQFGVLGVEDACSGMRSTITLCALGVAVAFMSDRPMWHRVIMVGACIPIATFCNILRVMITCVLYIFVDPEYATGTYHTALGLAMLLLAFGLFSGLGWVLNNLMVEEEGAAPA